MNSLSEMFLKVFLALSWQKHDKVDVVFLKVVFSRGGFSYNFLQLQITFVVLIGRECGSAYQMFSVITLL